MKIEGSIFNFVASLFKRYRIRGVLVGGYALIANNVQRMTFDIDFLVTSGDYDKIEHEFLNAGYSLFNRQTAFVQLKSSVHGLRDIDFLLADRHTIDIIIQHGKSVSIAGEEFPVPSPLHLIQMKLHSIAGNSKREMKDLPDIVQLMKANMIHPSDARIRELFDKYKLAGIYTRIKDLYGS